MTDKTDEIIDRTASRISDALDLLVADLPDEASPQMALEKVIGKLVFSQPWFLRLIMEDEHIREAYAVAVAERPLTARPK